MWFRAKQILDDELYIVCPHLAQKDAHLVPPAAFVQGSNSDPQIELRVEHPHVSAVDSST